MVHVAAKLPLTAHHDDWLRMERLRAELETLKPGDPRAAEIESILDETDNTQLVEIELND